MKHAQSARTTALVLALSCAITPLAQAADALTEAMQAAYAPYRAALFRTNGQGQAEAEQAMAQTRQAWSTIVSRYAAALPSPYDRDPRAAATLAEVAAVYDRAAAQVQARELVPAHETLELARDLMADLRRRNGVVVYSDHMNAYHEVMEHLVREGPKQLSQPQGPAILLARAGVLDYLAKRLHSEAPAALAANGDFVALQQQVQASVDTLLQALMRQDAAAAGEAMKRIKKPYSQLFLKFG